MRLVAIKNPKTILLWEESSYASEEFGSVAVEATEVAGRGGMGEIGVAWTIEPISAAIAASDREKEDETQRLWDINAHASTHAGIWQSLIID